MSNSTAPAAGPIIVDPSKVPPGGSVLHTTTTTQAPAQPPTNPLMDASNWLPLFTLLAGIALIMGFVTRYITGKFADYKEVHKPIHDGLERELAAINHKLNNERTRTDQLERSRQADVERIVRLETNFHAIEKGQERIEHAIDQMKEENAAGRAEIIQSRREMSKRELRP